MVPGTQSCQAGLQCCTSSNSCIASGSTCASGILTTTVSAAPVYVTPYGPATGFIALTSGNLCSGIADGKIACLSDTTFNICQGGVFAQAAPQRCVAGLQCCTATDRCEWPGQCGTYQYATNLCNGITDNHIACTSATTFNICAGGVFARAADQTCQAGLQCCTATNSCVRPGECPSGAYTPFVTPTVTVLPVAQNAYVCANPTTVAPVLVTSTSNPYPGTCIGIADGHISCTSDTSFNVCLGGVFASAQLQKCPAGTVCCTSQNACVYPGNCATMTYSYTIPAYTPTCTPSPIASATIVTVTLAPTTVITANVVTVTLSGAAALVPVATVYQPPPSACYAIPDGHISCLSATTFNICQRGVFAQAAPQSCPAGLICCSASNSCQWPGTCNVVTGNYCANIPDGHISCTSSTTFNICTGGVFASALDQVCQPGLQCCTATNSCVYPGQCPSPFTAVVPTATPVVVAPVVGLPTVVVVTPSPIVTSLSPYPNSCVGIPNGNLACRNATNFQYCINGAYVLANDVVCPVGTTCCTSANACVWPGSCPAVLYTVTPSPVLATTYVVQPTNIPVVTAVYTPAPNICNGVKDGNIACLSATTFETCQNNVLSTAAVQNCPAGLYCCAATNRCDYPGNCPVVRNNYCAGVANGNIACTGPTTFNICAGGVFATQVDWSCTAGTVCCAATSSCVYPGMCPSAANYIPAPAFTYPIVYQVPAMVTAFPPALVVATLNPYPNNCFGIPDGHAACKNATNFNICQGGVYAQAADQVCPLGLQCCTYLNECVYPGQCPIGTYTVTQAVATATISTVAVLPTVYQAPNLACTGMPSNSIVCLSQTTFNICNNGFLAAANAQTCAPGTVCCQATNRCDWAYNCPYAYAPSTSSCANIPDNHISCLTSTSFNICLGGVFANAAAQYCPSGTVCCASSNRCDWPSNCGVVAGNLCANIPDGHISCTGSTTFNICTGGVFAHAVDQTCVPGTVCCTALNQCVYPGQCTYGAYNTYVPPVLVLPPAPSYVTFPVVTATFNPFPNACAGISDGHIACRNSTNFNICQGGQYVIANDQVCQPGLVCCTSSNACVAQGQCPAVTYYVTPPPIIPFTPVTIYVTPFVGSTPSVTPTITPSVAPILANLSPCQSTLNNQIACANSTSFWVCLGGAPASGINALQSCQSGTVCCAATNKCDWPGNCPAVYGNLCYNVPNGGAACTGQTTYNICVGGVFQNGIDSSCLPGFVCCPALRQCVLPAQCFASLQSATPTPTPTVTSYVFQTSTVILTTATPNPYPNSCLGIPNGQISCRNATNYGFCEGGQYINAVDSVCPSGTTCCTAADSCLPTGKCQTFGYVYASTSYFYTTIPVTTAVPTVTVAPLITYTPNPYIACNGIPNGHITCYNATSFNICQNGLVAQAALQSCPAGTVCCTATNRCDWPGSCPVVQTNQCYNVPNGQISCTGPSTFNICTGGVFAYSMDQSCQPGLQCCGATNSCVYPGTCPTTNGVSAFFVQPRLKKRQVFVYPGVSTVYYYLPQVTNNVVPYTILAGLPVIATINPYPNACTGIPDGHIACKNSTNFNICQGGVYASAADQYCPAGTTCCTSSNSCVYVGQCPVVTYTVTPAINTYVPTYTPAPIAQVPTAYIYTPPTNICTGIPDGHISCLSSTTFNICQGGVFAQAAPQSCVAGTVCCTATNKCDWPGNCPVVYNNLCSSVPNSNLVCTSPYTFNICTQGVFASTLGFTCMPGTVCCQTTNSCVVPGTCPNGGYTYTVTIAPSTVYVTPTPTAVAPYVIVTTTMNPYPNSCLGIPDNQISCKSSTNFNICLNGQFVQAADQVCQPGLVCCTYANKCLYPNQCAPLTYTYTSYVLPPAAVTTSTSMTMTALSTSTATVTSGSLTTTTASTVTVTVVTTFTPSPTPCASVPDGHIYCLNAIQFNVCVKGVFALSSTQACNPGLVCCAATNMCDWPGNCPVVTANLCSGIPNGQLSCTSATTFNICTGGIFALTVDQTCLPGLQCCAALNQCVYPGQCPTGVFTAPALLLNPVVPLLPAPPLVVTMTPYPASCLGIPDNHISCLTSTTFNICSGGVFAQAQAQTCPAGLQCCTASNACVYPGQCPVVTYTVATPAATYVPTVIAAMTYATPTYTPAINVCSNIPNGHISCLSATTFNICQNGAFTTSQSQSCPAGTVCCTATNSCNWPGDCPVVSNNLCYQIPDNHISCTGATTFNVCTGGVFALAHDQSCVPGTVCCTALNQCVWPGSCPGGGYTYTVALPAIVTPTVAAAAVLVTATQNPYPGNCVGIADGHISCTNSTAFNVCLGGVPASNGALQSCPSGLTCCTASNSCVNAGQCAVVTYTVTKLNPTFTPVPTPVYVAPSSVCANIPDNHITCLSSSTFNICLGGQMAGAAYQTCPTGTVCCAATNSCNWPGNCPVVYANLCAGVPDNHIACTGTTTFNICLSGVFTGAVDQSCVPGTVCCTATNSCVWPGQCPTGTYVAPAALLTPSYVYPVAPVIVTMNPYPYACYGIPDNHIACSNQTAFGICMGGVLASNGAQQSCPANMVCCTAANACLYPGQCPAVTYTGTPAATVFQTITVTASAAVATIPVPAASCKGVLDNHITCYNPTTFNICLNGGYYVYPQTLQPTYTAYASPTIVPVVTTIPAYTGSCAGIADGHISCTDSATFGVCLGGVFASGGAKQKCQSGLTCCTALNQCVAAGACPTVTYTATLINPAVYATQGASMYTPASTACGSIPNGYISCVTSTTFNICNNGVFPSNGVQSCPSGTVCCAASNSCSWPGSCPVVVGNLCTNIPNNNIACTGSTTFNICTNGVFAHALDQSCQPGLVCCTATNSCVYPGQCPTGGYVAPAAIATPVVSLAYAPITATLTAYPNSCAGIPDNHIACKNATNFNICSGGRYVIAPDQMCPAGTTCCTSSNACVYPGQCPSVTYTVSAVTTTYVPLATPVVATVAYNAPNSACQNVPNGHISCLTAATFNICQNGAFSLTQPLPCGPGTVCCTATNRCDQPGNCPVVSNNLCYNVPNNNIACTGPTTWNVCYNGVFTNSLDSSCQPGFVCCTALNACVYPGTCPGPINVAINALSNPVALISGSCQGIPDGSISCISNTTFGICQYGSFYNAPAQSCVAGTVCCTAYNQCIWPGQYCPSMYQLQPAVVTVTPVPYVIGAYVYATPLPYVTVTIPQGSCTGVPNGNIACLTSNSFGVCQGGVFAAGANAQYCQANLICCQSMNQCVYPGQCPAVATVIPAPTPITVNGVVVPYGSCAVHLAGHLPDHCCPSSYRCYDDSLKWYINPCKEHFGNREVCFVTERNLHPGYYYVCRGSGQSHKLLLYGW
ncbi:hypothetical protein HK101_007564 [Irineochytrium annulatum]|nr:hypothetical protein HK101_007564 [Irineochytrium annulatum]